MPQMLAIVLALAGVGALLWFGSCTIREVVAGVAACRDVHIENFSAGGLPTK
jgi:hypothetical protein